MVISNVDAIWEDAGRQGLQVPAKLMTVKEAAEVAHCHEETIRRAYLAGQLAVLPFGSRGYRIHPADLQDWMGRGMRTKPNTH